MPDLEKEAFKDLRDLLIQPGPELIPRFIHLLRKVIHDCGTPPEQRHGHEAGADCRQDAARDVKGDEMCRHRNDRAEGRDAPTGQCEFSQIGSLNSLFVDDVRNAEIPKLVPQPFENVDAVRSYGMAPLLLTLLPMRNRRGQIIEHDFHLVRQVFRNTGGLGLDFLLCRFLEFFLGFPDPGFHILVAKEGDGAAQDRPDFQSFPEIILQPGSKAVV